MNKVDQVLRNYVDTTGLLLEQPPIDPMAAAPPAAPPMDPAALPMDPAIPPPEGVPAPDDGEEEKTKHITDQNYVMLVRDMLELLTINPEDLDDNEMGIFEDKVNPKNAYDIHDKLREVIESHGSPTG